MARRPLIGITPTPSTAHMEHGSFYRYCLSDTYVRSVWNAGGNPVILPWVSDTPEQILDEVDGIIISGGGDVDPTLFGQERHEQTDGIDGGRDSFEIALMRAALERELPTLAICRGIQVMNVALGGTLHQHLPDLGSAVLHRQHDAGYTQHEPSHLVRFDNTPNPVSEMVGKQEILVNSFHHQALDELAAPLELAGRAEDGVIEAVWHPVMRFGIGVQWHPEMLAAEYPDHARFFEGLVEAAKAPAAVN